MHTCTKTILKTKPLGLGLAAAFLILCSGTLRAADDSVPLPSTAELLEQVAALQESIAVLEESGHLNHGQATSLTKKLDKVTRALGSLADTSEEGDVSAQQVVPDFLRELGRAIDALLDFLGDLTQLLTDLPAEVVQPIIDAAIELLRDLIGVLLG